MARLVMTQLIANGEVKRGRIGVSMRNPDQEGTDAGRGAELEGAMISAVEPQSPAAQAGLAKGDLVTMANNVRIRSSSQFRNFIGLTPIGTEIDLRFRRGGEFFAAKLQIEPLKQKPPDRNARRN
jgi:S1-C subfamily serine protease